MHLDYAFQRLGLIAKYIVDLISGAVNWFWSELNYVIGVFNHGNGPQQIVAILAIVALVIFIGALVVTIARALVPTVVMFLAGVAALILLDVIPRI